MPMKFALTTVTALGLLAATGAWADGNSVWILQQGDRNSAQVEQNSGNGGSANQIGTQNDAARQLGNDNVLSITQGGTGSEVGTQGSGFDQTGNGHSATITQSGIGAHLVKQVLQSGAGNTLEITQGGSGNWVASVTQSVRENSGTLIAIGAGGPNRAVLVQTGTGNRIGKNHNTAADVSGGIQQQYTVANGAANTIGIAVTGDYNRIGDLTQRGAGREVTINVEGNRNFINQVNQNDSDLYGSFARLTIKGNDNGAGGLNGNFPRLGAFAAGSAALAVSDGVSWFDQGTIIQGRINNQLTYTVDGDANLFAFRQYGSDNAITATVTGNRNQTAVRHEFNANSSIVVQSGDDNDVGITTLAGSSGNIADATQTGDQNRIEIRIDGDNNGTGLFGGVAATLAGSSAGALVNGRALQDGDNNRLTHSILGDNNLFAFAQAGDRNTITAEQRGNHNQAAVLQAGSNNTTVFSQVGGHNNLAISQ